MASLHKVFLFPFLLITYFVGVFLTTPVESVSILIKSNRIVNMNTKLGRWPNGEVPFYIDKTYSLDETRLIRLAMLRVMADLDMAVRFMEVDATDQRYKVKITPLDRDENIGPTFSKLCHTFSGVFLPGLNAGKTEQSLILARGPDGCFDGTLHSLMKYFAVLLGLKNEHQRPDRDKFIEMAPNNVLPDLQMAYKIYDSNDVYVSCPYDYCSITHNQQEDFAQPQGKAFTVKQAPFFIPKLNQLSTCDCQQLKALYGGDQSSCKPLDCAAQILAPSLHSVTVSPLDDDTTTVCYSVAASLDGQPVSFTTTIPGSGGLSTTPASSARSCVITTAVTPSSTLKPSENTTSTATTETFPPVPSMEGEASFPDVPPGLPSSPNNPPLSDTKKRRRRRGATEGKTLRVINADPGYLKWAQNTVPFYIDAAYSSQQRALVFEAMQKVMSELHDCMRFVEVPRESPMYKIKITPSDDGTVNPDAGCRTIPGVSEPLVRNGATEQPLILSPGQNGCFDGSLGNLMKYFVLVLGRRNEHQRPDRDLYLDVNFTNVKPGFQMAYEKYTSSDVSASPRPYDYCSITHNEPDDYAVPGKAAFTIKNPQFTTIPKLDKLSEPDCRIVSDIYGCSAAACTPLDCTQSTGKAEGIPPTPNPHPPPGLFVSFNSLPATVSPNQDGTSRVCLQMPASSSDTTLTATTVIPHSFRAGTLSATISATTTCAPTSGSFGGGPLGPMYQQLQQLADQLQQQLNQINSPKTTTAASTESPSSSTGSPSSSTGSPSSSTGSPSGSTGSPSGASGGLMQQLDQLIQQFQHQLAERNKSTSASSGATTSAVSGTTSGGTGATTAAGAATSQGTTLSPVPPKGKEDMQEVPEASSHVLPPPPDEGGKVGEIHQLPFEGGGSDLGEPGADGNFSSSDQSEDVTTSGNTSVEPTTASSGQPTAGTMVQDVIVPSGQTLVAAVLTDPSVTVTEDGGGNTTPFTLTTELATTPVVSTTNSQTQLPDSPTNTTLAEAEKVTTGIYPASTMASLSGSTVSIESLIQGSSVPTVADGSTVLADDELSATTLVPSSLVPTSGAPSVTTLSPTSNMLPTSTVPLGSSNTTAPVITVVATSASIGSGSSPVQLGSSSSSPVAATTAPNTTTSTRGTSIVTSTVTAPPTTIGNTTAPPITTTASTATVTNTTDGVTTTPGIPTTTLGATTKITTTTRPTSAPTTALPSTVKSSSSPLAPSTHPAAVVTSGATTPRTTTFVTTTTKKTTTVKTTPAKTTSAKTTSAKTTPAKTTSAKITPAVTTTLPSTTTKAFLEQMGANLENMLGQINGAPGQNKTTQSYQQMQQSLQQMINNLYAMTKRPATGPRRTTQRGQQTTKNQMLVNMENSLQQMIEQLGKRTSTTKRRLTTKHVRPTTVAEDFPPPPPPF